MFDLLETKYAKLKLLFESKSSYQGKKTYGELLLLVDVDSGIFLDWNVNFKTVIIEQYCTNPDPITSGYKYSFKIRQELFPQLGIENIQRTSKRKESSKVIIVNNEQLKVFNEYFNSNKYKSTFKNIIAIIQGSNPSGERSNPESAYWLFYDEKDIENKFNFNILITLLLDNNAQLKIRDITSNYPIKD